VPKRDPARADASGEPFEHDERRARRQDCCRTSN